MTHADVPAEAAAPAYLVLQHAADIAESLNQTSRDEALALLARLPVEHAIDVFDQPELERAADLLRGMPSERAAAILSGMASDRQVDLIRQARLGQRDALFKLVDAQTAASLRRLLAYRRDSAGSIMTTEFVSAPATASVAEVL